jgi:hypothetical protein
VNIPGPLIVLHQGEPTSISIINRSTIETSVHWHGMELESYFDGVPGWGGDFPSRHSAYQAGRNFRRRDDAAARRPPSCTTPTGTTRCS